MSWFADRLAENNSKLAFGVIAGGAVFVLNNPSMLHDTGWAVWGPFLGGLLSQVIHILLPAGVPAGSPPDTDGLGPIALSTRVAAAVATRYVANPLPPAATATVADPAQTQTQGQ